MATINNDISPDIYKLVDLNNFKCKKEEITVDKSFEDMINDTYELMMRTEQLKSSNIPALNPLPPHVHEVREHPLARSSPKVIKKLKNIQPKPSPHALSYIPRILAHAHSQPLIVHRNNTSFQPISPLHFGDASAFAQMPSFPQTSVPIQFNPRSYTWKGLEGLQLNQTTQTSKLLTQVGAQHLAAAGHKVAMHSFVKPAGKRKLLPKPILSINQHCSSLKRNSMNPSIKFSTCSINPNMSLQTMNTKETAAQVQLVFRNPYEKQVAGQTGVLKQKFRSIPLSWRSREDPVKMKKNELEKVRRLEMAVYRENLRRMLPRTKYVKKVSSLVILKAAKDHCEDLQYQLRILEAKKRKEESIHTILTWKLTNMKYIF